jgi:hypothetical protein
MTRPAKRSPRTQRINMCLTEQERIELEAIAAREDRDLGYLATWFLTWGIQQYKSLNATLVELNNTKVVREQMSRKRATERLVLREEAQTINEQLSGPSPERKRA